jgi:hypothetical protein
LRKSREILKPVSGAARQNYRVRPVWALLLALEGKKAEALREMDSDMETYAGIHVFGPLQAAEVYAVAGEAEKALGWLDRGIRMGDDREDWLRRDPMLASLRTNPRFGQMLASVSYRRKQRAEGVAPLR